MKVGVVYHERYSQYDLGPGHPFRGDRFVNVRRFFEERGLFRLPHVVTLTPEPVTKQDLLPVHDEDYVETPVSPQILEAALLIIGGAVEAGRAIITPAGTMVVVSACLMTLQCL